MKKLLRLKGRKDVMGIAMQRERIFFNLDCTLHSKAIEFMSFYDKANYGH